MTQKELSEILHDSGCPVNEGVSSLKNEKVFPRIDYWEIMLRTRLHGRLVFTLESHEIRN